MSDDADEPKIAKPVHRAKVRKLRDMKVISEAMSGKSAREIARSMEINRATVAKILSSDESKRIIKEGESQIKGLIPNAIAVIVKALQDYEMDGDKTNALKSALAILKSTGLIRETVNMEHSFPKPTIIEKLDGSQVVLTTKSEDEA